MAASASAAVSAVHALVTEYDDDPLYGQGQGRPEVPQSHAMPSKKDLCHDAIVSKQVVGYHFDTSRLLF